MSPLLCVIVVQGVQYWKRVFLYNFGDVEIDFLDQIEEEFEDQLDHYVKFVDMTNFYF